MNKKYEDDGCVARNSLKDRKSVSMKRRIEACCKIKSKIGLQKEFFF